MKIKNKLLSIIALLAVMTISCFIGFGCAEDDIPTESATLTINGEIAAEGIMGKKVELPTASATDSDGTDLSDAVLLYVIGMAEDNTEAVYPLYGLQANVSHAFTPKTYHKWVIRYEVYGKDEKPVTKEFTYIVTDDTTAPTLKVNANGSITASAGSYIILPSATAEDDGADISSNIQVTVYKGEQYVNRYNTSGAEYKLMFPSGEYKAVYNVSDGAGNKADPVSIDIHVGKYAYGKEWLSDANWINYAGGIFNGEKNELEVGVTADSANKNECETALTIDKVGLNDYVALMISVDPKNVDGGEWLYHFGYYGSKNNDKLAPTGAEGSWPAGISVRGDDNSLTLRAGANDLLAKSSLRIKYYDGLTHSIVMRVHTTGASVSDENASVVAELWYDVSPLDTENFVINENYAKITIRCGDESLNVEGNDDCFMNETDFATFYNDAAGWLYFGSMFDASSGATPASDKMYVKSVKVYDSTLEGFTLKVPVIDIDKSSFETFYTLNTELDVPACSWTNAKTSNIYLIEPNGTIKQIENGKVVLSSEGWNTIVYRGVNEFGVDSEYKVKFLVVADVTKYTIDMPDDIVETVVVENESCENLKSAQYDMLETFEARQLALNGSGNGRINTIHFKSTLGDESKASNMDFGIFTVQLLGRSRMSTWFAGTGINLSYQTGSIMLCNGSKQFDSAFAVAPVCNQKWIKKENGKSVLDLYLAWRIDYVSDDEGGLLGVKFTVWAGQTADKMERISFGRSVLNNAINEVQSAKILAAPDAPYLAASTIEELGMTVNTVSQGAGVWAGWVQQNPNGRIDFTGVTTGDTINEYVRPDTPEVPDVTVTNVSGEKTSAQHGNDNNIQILSNSGDGQLVAMKLRMNGFSTSNTGAFGVQILGSEKIGSWFNDKKGLSLVINNNNLALAYNKEGENFIAVVYNLMGENGPYLNDANNTLEFYLAYEVEYVVEGDKFLGVKITVWTGKKLSAMTKVEGWAKYGLGTDANVATKGEVMLSSEDIKAVGKSTIEQGAVQVIYAQGPDNSSVAVSEVQLLETFPEPGTEPDPEPIIEVPDVPEVTIINESGEKISAQHGNDNNIQILSNSGNGQLIAMKLRMNGFSTANTGAFGVQILGSEKIGSWFNDKKGLSLVVNSNYIALCYTKELNDFVAVSFGRMEQYINEAQDTLEFYLVYKVDYIAEGNELKGVKVTVWTGKKLSGMSKVENWSKFGLGSDSNVATKGEINIAVGDLATLGTSVIAQGTVQVIYAQGPDNSSVAVSEVQLLEAFLEPELEVPEVTVTNESGEKISAQHGNDNNIQILSNSGNGQLVVMKLKMKGFSTSNTGAFGVQILGSEKIGSWFNDKKGLSLVINNNNLAIAYNKEQSNFIAVAYNLMGENGPYLNETKDTLEFYLAYEINYITSNGSITGVKVTVWTGKTLSSMTKVEDWKKFGLGTDANVATKGEINISTADLTEIGSSVIAQGAVQVIYAQGPDNSSVEVSEVQLLEAFPEE